MQNDLKSYEISEEVSVNNGEALEAQSGENLVIVWKSISWFRGRNFILMRMFQNSKRNGRYLLKTSIYFTILGSLNSYFSETEKVVKKEGNVYTKIDENNNVLL